MKTKNILLVGFLLLIPFTDFHAGRWVKKESLGGVARHRATGISIGQKGYIGLGHVNGTGVNFAYSDWWEYDPATNSWTQKADYLLGPGYGASAFSIGTKGYVGSGVFIGSEWCEYDPSTNQWTLIATPPATGTELSAFAVDAKGYLIESANIYEYDPASDQWTTKAVAPVSFGVWGSAFAIGNSGYVKSGSVFYEYKPSVDQWSQRATFPGLASGGSAAFVVLGKGYVIAGFGGSLGNVTKEVWEYDPPTNTWALSDQFLGSSRRFTVGFNIGDRGYIGTGTNGTNFKDFWEYDPLLMSQEELGNKVSIKPYPNPASDYLTVSIDGISTDLLQPEGKFILCDYVGRVVKQVIVTNNSFTVDVKNLSTGNYIYHLLSEFKVLGTGKIIIVK